MFRNFLNKIKHRLKRSKLFRDILYLLPAQVLTLRKVCALTLEVSSACNLKCVFCPVGNGKISPGFMDIETHHNIIDLLPKSIKIIRYSYRGDATLNKDFPKMIHYAHTKGFKTDLSTNGMLIDKYIKELVNCGLDRIIFAIDGATQEVQSKYRVGSDLEKIKNNVSDLVEAREKSQSNFPKEIIIQTVVTRHNEPQIPLLVKMAEDLGVDKIKFKTLAVSLGSEFLKGKDFQRNFLPKNKNYWRKGQDILICPAIWQTVILANGDVSICCNDYYGKYIAGNILEENNFKKVVYGKKYNILRRKILKKKLAICKACSMTGEYWISEISRAFNK
jgi:MoaA/NifB/PqqE/SkfB family radical SAM enzyme